VRRLTIEEAETRHPDLVKGQKWAGKGARYKYFCDIHREFSIAFDHRNQGRGCQKCAEARRRKSRMLTIEAAKARCPDMVDGQMWRGNLQKYRFLCRNHGEYWQVFGHHDSQNGGCPDCRESKGEKKVVAILERLSVSFARQFRIPECRNIRPLPFDFVIWIAGRVYLIEFQGEQHYRLSSWQGSNEQIQKTDGIKQAFCESNGIPLLTIPYWEEDVEGVIRRFLGSGELC
jgi:hypothetical protein